MLNTNIVFVGKVRLRYRFRLVKDALIAVLMAFRGYGFAGFKDKYEEAISIRSLESNELKKYGE